MIYTVGPGSRISLRDCAGCCQLENTSLVGVTRTARCCGRATSTGSIRAIPTALVIAPPAQSAALDELFGGTAQSPDDAATFAGRAPSMAPCRSARSRSSTICRCRTPESHPTGRLRPDAPRAQAADRGPRPRSAGIELVVQATARRAHRRSQHRARAPHPRPSVRGGAAILAAARPGAAAGATAACPGAAAGAPRRRRHGPLMPPEPCAGLEPTELVLVATTKRVSDSS